MYFEIRNCHKNIGRAGFPQSVNIKLDEGKSVNDPDFIWNLSTSSFPDFTPTIGTIVVRDGAKLTDFISSATISSGFIISQRVKSILENFRLATSKFYKCSLLHKDILIEGYYYLHTLNKLVFEIDFERSSFNIMSSNVVEETQKFNNFDELQSRSDEINRTNGKYKLQFDRLYVSKFNAEESDLFETGIAGYGTFISGSLKKALEENNITGVNYREAKISCS